MRLGHGAVIALALFAACDSNNGYFDKDGEFNAGGMDPTNFPPPYRGDRASRQIAASGTFTEIGAIANGRPVGYFSFPFSPSQVPTTNYASPTGTAWPDGVIDPLRINGPGTDFRQSAQNPAPVPLVYNFDPPGNQNPFAPSVGCSVPDGYSYDPRVEAFPLDTQWNIFAFPPDRFTLFPPGALPTWSYRPVVAEVSVKINDLDCQSVKSERTLLARNDDGKVDMTRGAPEPDKSRLGLPTPDRYLAWAIIDPGSPVVRVGQKVDVQAGGIVSGTSVQHYGWFGQFILAYIDGGYIPIEDGQRIAGVPTKRIRPQRLYYPRSSVILTATGKSETGALGHGYDVLQGDRFSNDGVYSPVCEVWTYQLPQATAQEDLPKSEAEIIAAANSTLEPARTPQQATAFTPNGAIVPRYIFCLQAAPRDR